MRGRAEPEQQLFQPRRFLQHQGLKTPKIINAA